MKLNSLFYEMGKPIGLSSFSEEINRRENSGLKHHSSKEK